MGAAGSSADVVADRSSSSSQQPAKFSWTQALNSYVVLTQRNPLRTFWSVIVAVLLVYTGTVLPFRLAFIDLAMPDPLPAGPLDPIDDVVDAIFWIDLLVNFFFTYVDATGREVTSIPLIAVRYLKTYFVINLVACLPTATIGWLFGLFLETGDDKGLHKTLRIARLQRVSRLARLVRLVRLAKFMAIMRENPVWSWIQSLRGVRIINLCFSLLWSVHIVACGFYLCAAFHTNQSDTWVARREISPDGDTLLDAGVYTHWINAMYFVLTVFTTVGFGDMSAWTHGEIIYVCFTMILGCIINSIILSSVITILTNVDHEARQVDDQRLLLEAFAKHAHLDSLMALRLTKWASATVPLQPNFDRSWLKQLLTSRAIPRDLAGDLLARLYDGHLMRNKFMMACQGYHLPPRFPLIMALHVNMQYFEPAEIVYFPHDNAWNLFMIISGVFSCFAVPSPAGGRAESPSVMDDALVSRSRVALGTKSLNSRKNNESKKNMVDKQNASTPLQLNAPYQILGHGNYFGEHELLHTATRARQTGVRCEVDGCTLVLAKEHLVEIMSEFPFVARSWRNASTQREFHRMRMLQRHVKKMSIRTLAVTTIQRYVRYWRLPSEQRQESRASLGATGGTMHRLNTRGISGMSGVADGDAGGLQGEVAELRGDVRQLHAMLSDVHAKLSAR